MPQTPCCFFAEFQNFHSEEISKISTFDSSNCFCRSIMWSRTVIIILSKLWANLPTDPEIQLCDPTPMLHSPRPHYRAKLGCTNHIITFSNGLVGVWQVISESFQFVFHLKTIIQKFTQFLHHALRDRPDPVYLPIWLG